MNKSPLTKKYNLASRYSQRLNQSLQESIFFSTPKSNSIFPPPFGVLFFCNRTPLKQAI